MEVENILKKKIEEYLSKKYSISKTKIEILKTRKEFKGDYTIVLFPLLPIVKKTPVEFGNELGNFLKENEVFVQEFNNNYIILKIKYLGKLDKVIKQLKDQNIILELIEDEWRIKLS